MAISGGIKFFDNNEALLSKGTSASASNGNSLVNNCLDRNPLTYWRTASSSDAETVTIDITLPQSTTFSRIFLLDHNFLNFSVQYDLSGVFTDFTNVVGITALPGAGIAETAFAQDTAYYEFDSVTSSSIRISVTTTQVADADKFLNQLIICTELGTFGGFPEVKRNEFSKNERRLRMLSGKSLIIKSEESFRVDLSFKNWPSTYNSDLDLAQTLFDRDEQFMIWLCGGRFGSDYFRITNRGFRLKDVKTVQTLGSYNPKYVKNTYVHVVNAQLKMEEVVD